jgi:hypothetical protein
MWNAVGTEFPVDLETQVTLDILHREYFGGPEEKLKIQAAAAKILESHKRLGKVFYPRVPASHPKQQGLDLANIGSIGNTHIDMETGTDLFAAPVDDAIADEFRVWHYHHDIVPRLDPGGPQAHLPYLANRIVLELYDVSHLEVAFEQQDDSRHQIIEYLLDTEA